MAANGNFSNTSWLEFADILFRTEDADPMYYALARANLDQDTLARFFVGWCTYYHPGVAAMAAQFKDAQFWATLRMEYHSAPRASERRHFRGQAGLNALDSWQASYPQPERMVYENFGPSYGAVRHNLKSVAQFGDYFYWKFADVQERVFHVPCNFRGRENDCPKVPKEGAGMIFNAMHPGMVIEASKLVPYVFGAITKLLQPRLAPPWYDRPINMQEAETVCCVWHQAIGGGYEYYGHRTDKAFKRLSAYRQFPVAEALLDALTLSLPHKPEGELL